MIKKGKETSRNETKCKNIQVDKQKQVRSSRQNDKLEQWVTHWAVKDEVLGLILSSKE